MTKRFGIAAAAVLATALLGGCQVLGITHPLTFDEQLATAYVAHTAVVQAATAAVTAHTITSAQAQKVSDMAVDSRAMLDEAKTLEGIGNTAGASNELSLATAALSALQAYVNNQGAKQ